MRTALKVTAILISLAGAFVYWATLIAVWSK